MHTSKTMPLWDAGQLRGLGHVLWPRSGAGVRRRRPVPYTLRTRASRGFSLRHGPPLPDTRSLPRSVHVSARSSAPIPRALGARKPKSEGGARRGGLWLHDRCGGRGGGRSDARGVARNSRATRARFAACKPLRREDHPRGRRTSPEEKPQGFGSTSQSSCRGVTPAPRRSSSASSAGHGAPLWRPLQAGGSLAGKESDDASSTCWGFGGLSMSELTPGLGAWSVTVDSTAVVASHASASARQLPRNVRRSRGWS